MTLSFASALHWTAVITGVAVFFQTLELISIRRSIDETGVWRWKVIRQDFSAFPHPVRTTLDAFLSYQGFLFVLAIRLICAIAMAFTIHIVPTALVFITTLLIALRWRGSFNGGSDFMNLIVLSALCVGSAFKESASIGSACLWYIAIQTCTSYFVAGIIKLRRENWRNGTALSGFLTSTIFSPDPLGTTIAKSRPLVLIASWTVMLFECSFPLALANEWLCLAMMGLALVFHIANFYFFGLNRFVLSWAAAYPALIYCAISKFR